MECAYDRGRLYQCHPYKRLTFDTQQGVINTVCVRRKQEYLKSISCFSKHILQYQITTACLKALATNIASSKDPCRTLNLVLECARTKVLMTDGCDSVDSDLMQDLVETFFRPSLQELKCSSLATKAGESKQEHVGDESSQGKINSAPVSVSASQQPLLTEINSAPVSVSASQQPLLTEINSAPVSGSASQQPLLKENLKSNESAEGTDGEDIKTSNYESLGTLSQYTSHDTTVTYLDEVTLSSQSVSWTNTDDRHKDEQTSPEITSPHNQDGIQKSQGSAHGLELDTIKSVTKHSTNSAILVREFATSGIWPTVSTVPGSEGLDKTVMWATESSTLRLELENTERDNKNANRPSSQSNKVLKVMALKSTQRSGNDATTQWYRKSLQHMLLSLIISLVLFVK